MIPLYQYVKDMVHCRSLVYCMCTNKYMIRSGVIDSQYLYVTILSSTANATLLLLLLFIYFSFRLLNLSIILTSLCPISIKMTRKSVCVLPNPKFSVHAREHASGYRNEFSVPRARGLEFFQNNALISNL